MYGIPQQLLVQSLPDPAPNWLWTLDLSIPSIGAINNLYIREVSVPFLGFDMETRFRGGLYYHFPKHPNLSSLMVTFYETIFFDITYFLSQWSYLVRNPGGNFGLPVDFCGTGTFTCYDYVGVPQLSVNVSGMWPIRRGNFDMHYNSSNEIMVNCEFAATETIIQNPLSGGGIGSVESALTRGVNNPLINSLQPLAGVNIARIL